MKDETHKRMAGDYEIIQAIHIGDWEIVLGEKPQSESGDKYILLICCTQALTRKRFNILLVMRTARQRWTFMRR